MRVRTQKNHDSQDAYTECEGAKEMSLLNKTGAVLMKARGLNYFMLHLPFPLSPFPPKVTCISLIGGFGLLLLL